MCFKYLFDNSTAVHEYVVTVEQIHWRRSIFNILKNSDCPSMADCMIVLLVARKKQTL